MYAPAHYLVLRTLSKNWHHKFIENLQWRDQRSSSHIVFWQATSNVLFEVFSFRDKFDWCMFDKDLPNFVVDNFKRGFTCGGFLKFFCPMQGKQFTSIRSFSIIETYHDNSLFHRCGKTRKMQCAFMLPYMFRFLCTAYGADFVSYSEIQRFFPAPIIMPCWYIISYYCNTTLNKIYTYSQEEAV